MAQRVPRYLEADLPRIVRRDYPEALWQEAEALLATYGKEPHEAEVLRIRIDCLKIANGDMEELRNCILLAKADYRDVIVNAEYPSMAKYTGDFSSRQARARMRSDWNQLMRWLRGGRRDP